MSNNHPMSIAVNAKTLHDVLTTAVRVAENNHPGHPTSNITLSYPKAKDLPRLCSTRLYVLCSHHSNIVMLGFVDVLNNDNVDYPNVPFAGEISLEDAGKFIAATKKYPALQYETFLVHDPEKNHISLDSIPFDAKDTTKNKQVVAPYVNNYEMKIRLERFAQDFLKVFDGSTKLTASFLVHSLMEKLYALPDTSPKREKILLTTLPKSEFNMHFTLIHSAASKIKDSIQNIDSNVETGKMHIGVELDVLKKVLPCTSEIVRIIDIDKDLIMVEDSFIHFFISKLQPHEMEEIEKSHGINRMTWRC